MCLSIVRDVLERVRPERMVDRAWPVVAPRLESLPAGRIDLIAAGKGSLGLTRAILDRLQTKIERGLVLAPSNATRGEAGRTLEKGIDPGGRVRLRPVEHPAPTQRNVDAASEVERLIRGASAAPGRTLLVLLSGGGSAHLTLPMEPLTLESIADVSTRLMLAGAPIAGLNTVRKHTERLKGGRLAQLADERYDAVLVLVVSDVIGDDLSVIASGPCSPDPTTYADAIDVLTRHGLTPADVPKVWSHLASGVAGDIPETPKPGDRCFDRVHHTLIGTNRDAVDGACDSLKRLGVRVDATRLGVSGESRTCAKELVDRLVSGSSDDTSRAIVWGGETTVNVTDAGGASGIGGRNQEFALAAAMEIPAGQSTLVLAFGTDGVDGPTDAAGGFATGDTFDRIRRAGVDPVRAINGHDSHRALGAADSLIRTGPTGTNAGDVMIAIRFAEAETHGEKPA